MLNERFSRREFLAGTALGFGAGLVLPRIPPYASRALDYVAWRQEVSEGEVWQESYLQRVKELQESLFIPDVCVPGRKPIPIGLRRETTVWDLQKKFGARQEDILALNQGLEASSVLFPKESPQVLIPPTRKAVVLNTSGSTLERRIQEEKRDWSYIEADDAEGAQWIRERAGRLVEFVNSGFQPQTDSLGELRDLCIFLYHGYGEELTTENAQRVIAHYILKFEQNFGTREILDNMKAGTKAINDAIRKTTSPDRFRNGQIPTLPESPFGEVIFIPNAPNTDKPDVEWGYLASDGQSIVYPRFGGGFSYDNWYYPLVFGDYDALDSGGSLFREEFNAEYFLTDTIWHELVHTRVQPKSLYINDSHHAYHVSMGALSLIGWETLGMDPNKMAQHAKPTLFIYEALRKGGVENTLELLVEAAATRNGERLVETYKKLNSAVLSWEMQFYMSIDLVGTPDGDPSLQYWAPSWAIENFIKDYRSFLQR